MDIITTTICQTCGVGLANDDWTSREDEGAALAASLELLAAPAVIQDPTDGYITCWVCDEDTIGGYTAELTLKP